LKLFDVRRLKDFRRTATVTTLRDPIMSLQRRSPIELFHFFATIARFSVQQQYFLASVANCVRLLYVYFAVGLITMISPINTGNDVWQLGICHVGQLVRRPGGLPSQMLK